MGACLLGNPARPASPIIPLLRIATGARAYHTRTRSLSWPQGRAVRTYSASAGYGPASSDSRPDSATAGSKTTLNRGRSNQPLRSATRAVSAGDRLQENVCFSSLACAKQTGSFRPIPSPPALRQSPNSHFAPGAEFGSAPKSRHSGSRPLWSFTNQMAVLQSRHEHYAGRSMPTLCSSFLPAPHLGKMHRG